MPHKWTTKFIPNLSLVKIKKFAVVLVEDTHHLCKRFSFDGIEAMSRGISGRGGGGKQVIKFENMSNRGRLCYSIKTVPRFNSHAKCTVRVSTSFTHLRSLLLPRKVTMTASTNSLPLPSSR